MSVYIFHGDRGGTGKTTTAATFTEYLVARNEPVFVLDADTRNNELYSMFKCGSVPSDIVYLRDTEGWANLGNLLSTRDEPNVVLSLPANIGEEVTYQSDFIRDILTGLDRSLVVFWTLNRSPQSVGLLIPVLDALGSTAKAMVAVRNLYFGDTDRFVRWNTSNTRKKFLANTGLEIDLPELLDSIMDETMLANPIRRLSSTDALPYAHRLIAKRWLSTCYAAYDSICDKVGIGVR